MTTLRSGLFLLGAVLITVPFGILVPAGRILGSEPPFTLARLYTKIMLRWVEISCGITYEVTGWEHVPKTPVIIMSKHQSAWETIFIESAFPSQCWIVKKELLWLPFVGWGLMAIRAIAIDRTSGSSAREQIVVQGAERLKEGHWVTIFPEGTRVARRRAAGHAHRHADPAHRAQRGRDVGALLFQEEARHGESRHRPPNQAGGARRGEREQRGRELDRRADDEPVAASLCRRVSSSRGT